MQSYHFAKSLHVLLAGASAMALASPAMAQDADQGGLGEIIVTAQKREQNLQQVPISISAVAGEQLELRGITETKQLGAIAPNVSALGGTTSGGAAVLTIRGIATPADETQGFDSPVGLYIDGVYLARSAGSTFEIGEVERVEVLRGPQGTLFGRNTTGGAINFISRQPKTEAGLNLKAGYGNYDLWTIRGTADTGNMAGDTLRMSFSGMYKKRDGVVDNRLRPDNQDPGSDETYGGRFSIVWEPTSDIKITNIADYTKSKGVPLPMQLAAVGTGALFNPDPAIVAFANANNISIAAPGPVGPYLAQSSTRVLEAGCPIQVSLKRLDQICNNFVQPATDKFWGNLLRIEVDAGPVKVRSSTALRRWRSLQLGGDLDGLGTLNGAALGPAATTLNGFPANVLTLLQIPAPNAAFLASQPVFSSNLSLFDATNVRDQNQFSQEIEILSNNDGAFNWVIGGFYFKETGSEQNRQIFGFVLDTNAAVYNSTNFGPAAGLLQSVNPARYRAALQDIGLSYRAAGRSTAIYGQAEYRPGGKDGAFGVTLGLRYTWDHKEMNRTQNGALPFTSATDIALNTGKADFSALTGNLTIDYRATDDINLYARVAKGYRSGGFNAREPGATTVGRGGFLPFNNEKIWSYEAGFKTQFGSTFRLNGAVFHNVYTDLQVAVPISFGGGGSSFGTAVQNVGKINYTGFELEGQIRASEYFWLDGNLGYTRKSVKEYNSLNNAGARVNIASTIIPGYAPDWTASLGANARFDLGGDAKVFARLGLTHTSEYFQFGNPLNNPFYRETKGDARTLLDAQVRVSGIKAGGSELELTVWGKNLTNKEYVMRSVDFGALGFATTIYGEPATYGVTLGISF